MSLRLILHSTQLFGSSDPFVLKAIDGMLWYMSHQKLCNEAEVIFHPTRNPFNVFGIMLNGIGKVKRLPEGLMHRLSRAWAKKLSVSRMERADVSDNDSQHLTIIDEILSSNNGHDCIFSNVAVRLRNKPYPIITSIQDFFLVHAKGIQLFIRCFEKGKFNGTLLLKIRYGSILIGDIVGSSALRLRPYGGGSLSHCKLAVLEQLVDAITFVRYININLKDCLGDKENAAVLVREPTYLDAIYTRLLSHYGVGVIDIYRYNSVYRFVHAGKYLPFHERAIERHQIKLNDDSIAKAVDYLSDRVGDPSRHLKYMKKGLNLDTDLLDEDRKPIKLIPGMISAAVFLHSFDDAQYVFGPDGFADLFEWTEFTIKTLLSNPKIGKVLIKSHPNVDYRNYPGDKKAIQRLKKMFPVSDKLAWVNSCSGPRSFKNAGDFIGITHHGSIAEELVILGIPVIASICAPWRDQYHFVRIWRSPDQYRALLQKNPSDFSVNEEERLQLFDYVCEARLSANITNQDRWPWYEIMDILGLESSGAYFDVLARAREMLRKMPLQQDELISYFVAQLKKYRELNLRACS
jgi:hypothetical protein